MKSGILFHPLILTIYFWFTDTTPQVGAKIFVMPNLLTWSSNDCLNRRLVKTSATSCVVGSYECFFSSFSCIKCLLFSTYFVLSCRIKLWAMSENFCSFQLFENPFQPRISHASRFIHLNFASILLLAITICFLLLQVT